MATAGTNIRDMAAPYQLLLDRLEDSIKLRNLLCELLFMVLYSIFFIVFVVIQANTESVSEVNFAIESSFRYKSFPSTTGEAIAFDAVQSPNDWNAWFENVALPTVLESKYSSAIGYSRSPTQFPTWAPSRAPAIPTVSPPSARPSEAPSHSPQLPTAKPSVSPTFNASSSPSSSPSSQPPPPGRLLDSDVGKDSSKSTFNPAQTSAYYAVLAQKRVTQASGGSCVQAPAFLWNSLVMLNSPSTTPARPSNSAVVPFCYPPYSAGAESTTPIIDIEPVFAYYFNSPINAVGFLGAMMTPYSASGYYSQRINASSFAAWAKIRPKFVTSGTRLISFYSFAYNPTYNVWSSIGLYAEFLESGLVLTSTDSVTAPLMYCSSAVGGTCSDDVAEMAMATVTAVFIILHLVILVAYRRTRALYRIVFKSGIRGKGQVFQAWMWDLLGFWVLLDIAQCALGIISLAYIAEVYWWRWRYNDLVDISLSDPSQQDIATVNSYLIQYSYMQQIFGVQIILFNIQVFKYFPALPCFSLIRVGWYNAYLDVIKVFIMYWTLIFFYAFVGLIAFGQIFFEVSSYATAINTVIQMILGEASFENMRQQSPIFAWIYMLFFLVVFVYLMQALFLSVVIEGFRLAFNSHDGKRKSKATLNDVVKKLMRSDFAMSTEYAARLKAWKALRVNRNAEDISWSQLRAALRGQVHNRLDIPDESVDEVFLLVNGLDLKPLKPPKETKDDSARIPVGDPTENSSFVLQIVRNMFELKANERNLMKQVGSLMKEMRRSQAQCEALLAKADAASSTFAKDE